MGSSYISAPVIFLIDTLFSLYILAVVLRFLLQWSGADSRNAIAQMLIKITHPPLKLLRRFIPSIRKIDTSALVLAFGLQLLADFAIFFVMGNLPSIGALCVISFTSLLSLVINVFIFAIFAGAILSWFNPGTFNTASGLLYSLSEPVLRVCRQIVPDMGGVDFSSLVALIMLQLAKMLLLPPLQELAALIS